MSRLEADPRPTYGRFTAEIEVRDERTASDFASEASDALGLYFKYRRENRQQDRDLCRMWLTEASRLLERAIELEGLTAGVEGRVGE